MMEQLHFLYSYLLDGKGGGQVVDIESIGRWSPDQGNLWVHFDVANADCANWLRHSSGLKSYAIDALLAGETRPHSVIFEDGVLVVLRGVNTNPGADPEDMVSIRVWIEGERVISTRRRRLLSVEDVNDAIREGRGPRSASEFLPALVERMANRIGTFVDAIEAQLDESEEPESTLSIGEARTRLTLLRRQIAAVRRFLGPQRDALDRLNRQSTALLSEVDVDNIRQEADRITRYLEDLDLGRERAIVLQEEFLSRIAQEQNSRMYVLSVVAAVFLPLTFITGLLGMNVGGLPGVDSHWGFLGSVVAMVLAGVLLLVFFRRKKWL